ncbi:MAG TPA: Si-specific NAD(P)(+) transhydrogenase [Candidatus Polarisedimenticolia bacterium]|nr:Si-specific NAD(P)(+) transhydrogenase [Candidatus Polarisedimenticolia bacterium]
MTARPYDLVVIGSGPAGEKGAAQAAYFGRKVALVEREPHLGGAAANTGTLPSKTLRETSLYLSGFRQRGLYGLEANLRERATVRDFLRRERVVKETERRRVEANMRRHHVDLYHGAARFTSPGEIEVSGPDAARLTASIFLIATGSSPHRPAPFPFGEPGIHDSDTILDLEALPRSMAVAGGGVIGCEYACIFAALGASVHLIEARDRLLAFLDEEIVAALVERMAALGVRLLMPDAVSSVERRAPGWRLTLKSGRVVEADVVLAASGRGGNTAGLGLEAAGVPAGPRGLLAVDEHFRTAVPHIYAAGDVIGFPALASTSMEQARLAMCHAFQLSYKQALAPILPYGIYTIPEVSAAGESEASARAKGIDVVAGKALFAANARGQIVGDEHGFLKLVFDRETMTLLGTHVIGESASELVHVGLTAMLAGQGADLFIQTCYNYPTLTETYKYATYDALGRR